MKGLGLVLLLSSFAHAQELKWQGQMSFVYLGNSESSEGSPQLRRVPCSDPEFVEPGFECGMKISAQTEGDRSCEVTRENGEAVSSGCSLAAARPTTQNIQLATELIRSCVQGVTTDVRPAAFRAALLNFDRSDSPLQLGMTMGCPVPNDPGSEVEVCYRFPESQTFRGLDRLGIKLKCGPEQLQAKSKAKKSRSIANKK